MLRSTEPLQLENIVIGQYGKSEDGSLYAFPTNFTLDFWRLIFIFIFFILNFSIFSPAYIDDPTVPDVGFFFVLFASFLFFLSLSLFRLFSSMPIPICYNVFPPMILYD